MGLCQQSSMAPSSSTGLAQLSVHRVGDVGWWRSAKTHPLLSYPSEPIPPELDELYRRLKIPVQSRFPRTPSALVGQLRQVSQHNFALIVARRDELRHYLTTCPDADAPALRDSFNRGADSFPQAFCAAMLLDMIVDHATACIVPTDCAALSTAGPTKVELLVGRRLHERPVGMPSRRSALTNEVKAMLDSESGPFNAVASIVQLQSPHNPGETVGSDELQPYLRGFTDTKQQTRASSAYQQERIEVTMAHAVLTAALLVRGVDLRDKGRVRDGLDKYHQELGSPLPETVLRRVRGGNDMLGPLNVALGLGVLQVLGVKRNFMRAGFSGTFALFEMHLQEEWRLTSASLLYDLEYMARDYFLKSVAGEFHPALVVSKILNDPDFSGKVKALDDMRKTLTAAEKLEIFGYSLNDQYPDMDIDDSGKLYGEIQMIDHALTGSSTALEENQTIDIPGTEGVNTDILPIHSADSSHLSKSGKPPSEDAQPDGETASGLVDGASIRPANLNPHEDAMDIEEEGTAGFAEHSNRNQNDIGEEDEVLDLDMVAGSSPPLPAMADQVPEPAADNSDTSKPSEVNEDARFPSPLTEMSEEGPAPAGNEDGSAAGNESQDNLEDEEDKDIEHPPPPKRPKMNVILKRWAEYARSVGDKGWGEIISSLELLPSEPKRGQLQLACLPEGVCVHSPRPDATEWTETYQHHMQVEAPASRLSTLLGLRDLLARSSKAPNAEELVFLTNKKKLAQAASDQPRWAVLGKLFSQGAVLLTQEARPEYDRFASPEEFTHRLLTDIAPPTIGVVIEDMELDNTKANQSLWCGSILAFEPFKGTRNTMDEYRRPTVSSIRRTSVPVREAVATFAGAELRLPHGFADLSADAWAANQARMVPQFSGNKFPRPIHDRVFLDVTQEQFISDLDWDCMGTIYQPMYNRTVLILIRPDRTVSPDHWRWSDSSWNRCLADEKRTDVASLVLEPGHAM
uniref:Uncharacterized protein n=1 Tax=Mycena chlorophos TaxID=658473 RepID=A0ABQ0KX08_MYCCL|nr:predicted protein [Mycena chlorophos]